ncbi:hypothetical protein [Bradyrhizobium manausense]|uniref:hypothetical protein n=1 Tax=Bradyrhizobium manausense TaxID=989370 RepID=UPI001BA57F52|nr:hypothetical protein [Bradyrhizobium manausense]
MMKAFPQRYQVFVEAPEDLDGLCERARGWDRDYEIAYRDNGIEFTFVDRVAALKFLLITRSLQP